MCCRLWVCYWYSHWSWVSHLQHHEIAPSSHHPILSFSSHFIYSSDAVTCCHIPPAPGKCSVTAATKVGQSPVWNKTSRLFFFLLHPSFQKTSPYSTGGSVQPCCWQGQSWSTGYLGPQTMLCEDKFLLHDTLKSVLLGGSLKARVWAFLMWENGTASMQTAPN